MSKESVFLKLPIPFKKGVNIFPPSVNDIIGTPDFNMYIYLLLKSQEEISDIYVEQKIETEKIPTPFEFLLSFAASPEMKIYIEKGLEFFLHKEVVLLPQQKAIVVGFNEAEVTSVEEITTILESEFFDFQNCLRESIGLNKIEKPRENEPEKIKRMKAKARYRDRIKQKQKTQNGVDLFTSLNAICCMNMGLNPLNIGEISYASISTLIAMYQQKESYDNGIRSLLAGAKKKDVNLKYWIREIKD